MWGEFVVGSRLAPRVSLRFPWLSAYTKTMNFKFQFDLRSLHSKRSRMSRVTFFDMLKFQCDGYEFPRIKDFFETN